MTRERLKRYRALVEEREQLEALMQGPEARRSAALMERYQGTVRSIEAETLAIEQAIDSLEPTARAVLRYRYIQGLQWRDIWRRMYYSRSAVFKKHRAALEALEEEKQ